jgi:adenylate kinase
LTGTPGTGKTNVAREIARRTGARVIDANALVKRRALWSNKAKREADLAALKKEIVKEIKVSPCGFVAEGHLLCEFPLPRGAVDACVVLRCDPRVLKKRLEARRYRKKKIAENVLCEILDYCLVKSEAHYGEKRVVQVNATKRVSAEKIVRAALNKRSDSVDWTRLLLDERFKNGLGLS